MRYASYMKKWQIGTILVLVALLICGYAFRTDVRDLWAAWNQPKLPPAVRITPATDTSGSLAGDDTSMIEGGVATSEHYTLVSGPSHTPTGPDPLADRGALPSEVNLPVPFTSQAPTGDWGEPFQDACEETSAVMVDAYYKGVSGKIPADQATADIQRVVAYENKTLGDYKDTDAAETAQWIKDLYGYQNVFVFPLQSPDQIKRALANGYPVIIPFSGKELPNPNFRNGGPLYHMLVVKGYTADRFITNDPGTRNGADFTYTYDALMGAAHDWNNGNVPTGKPVMIIVMPNP